MTYRKLKQVLTEKLTFETPVESDALARDLLDMVSFDDVDAEKEGRKVETELRGMSVDLWMADGIDELSFAVRLLLQTERDAPIPKWNGVKSTMLLAVPEGDAILSGKVVEFVGDGCVLRPRKSPIEDELYRQGEYVRAIVVESPVLTSRRVLLAATRSDLIQSDQREPGVDVAMKIFSACDGRRVFFASPQASQFGVLRPGIWWDSMAQDGRLHIVLCNLDRIIDTGRDSASPVRGAIKMFREHAVKFYPGAWRWECLPESKRKGAQKILSHILSPDDEGPYGRLRNWRMPTGREVKPCDRKCRYAEHPPAALKTLALRFYLRCVEDNVTGIQSEDKEYDGSDCEKLAVSLYGMVDGSGTEKDALFHYLRLSLATAVAEEFCRVVRSEVHNALSGIGPSVDAYALLMKTPTAMRLMTTQVKEFSKRAEDLRSACWEICSVSRHTCLSTQPLDETHDENNAAAVLARLKMPSIVREIENDLKLRERICQGLSKLSTNDRQERELSIRKLSKFLGNRVKRQALRVQEARLALQKLKSVGVCDKAIQLLYDVAMSAPSAVLSVVEALSL